MKASQSPPVWESKAPLDFSPWAEHSPAAPRLPAPTSAVVTKRYPRLRAKPGTRVSFTAHPAPSVTRHPRPSCTSAPPCPTTTSRVGSGPRAPFPRNSSHSPLHLLPGPPPAPRAPCDPTMGAGGGDPLPGPLKAGDFLWNIPNPRNRYTLA